jgi:hypothetical protein
MEQVVIITEERNGIAIEAMIVNYVPETQVFVNYRRVLLVPAIPTGELIPTIFEMSLN